MNRLTALMPNWFSTSRYFAALVDWGWAVVRPLMQIRVWDVNLKLVWESCFPHECSGEGTVCLLNRRAHPECWKWERGTYGYISYYLFVRREYVGVLVITLDCVPPKIVHVVLPLWLFVPTGFTFSGSNLILCLFHCYSSYIDALVRFSEVVVYPLCP